MEDRNDLMRAKVDELKQQARDGLAGMLPEGAPESGEIEDSLFSSGFINITAPKQEPMKMYAMTFTSLRDLQGESVKPGNIKLNIKKLLNNLPEMVTASYTLADSAPVLKVCAALNIWKYLRQAMTVEITENHALVVIALWDNCDNKQKITLDRGFECVNNLCRRLSREELDWEEYIGVVEGLAKNANLELNDGGIWLCEWVSRKYR